MLYDLWVMDSAYGTDAVPLYAVLAEALAENVEDEQFSVEMAGLVATVVLSWQAKKKAAEATQTSIKASIHACF